ncbi:MAG: NAD(P)H-quinone oxidoreductase [Pyrinomonadaceae bacterium]
MKAIYIEEYGAPELLRVKNVDAPIVESPVDVIVGVKAAALNRADILQRKGLYPAPSGYPEKIPGLEFAGVVQEVGEKVQSFKPGERVFGITAGGAQAELLRTRADQLLRIPENLEFVSAAAVPEAFATAFDAMLLQGKLQSGEFLLIHAVGSGVGLAALQLGKAFGATVIGTSRTKSKLQRCEVLGLDFGIDSSEDAKFSNKVCEFSNKIGANLTLDLVGAKFLEENIRSAAEGGRILFVGLVGGSSSEINLATVLSKRLTIIGTVLRSRTNAEKAALTAKFSAEVLPLFAKNKIKPIVERVFAFEEVAEAHKYLESNESFGKVVLAL